MRQDDLMRKIEDIVTDEDVIRQVLMTRELMTCYRCAIMEVETKFRVLDEKFSLHGERNPIESIKSRVKSPESIAAKLRRKGLPMTAKTVENELNDVAGVRVICSFVDDIYTLAEWLTGQDDITLIATKDYIKNPKPNGYRSLHLIISIPIFLDDCKRNMKVEVQLRTITMESWANLEHKLRYKKDLSEEVTAKISEDLYECSQLCALLDDKMSYVKGVVAGRES